MSTNNIDSRVVQMQFDNKQFESGVSTTMKTVDALKKSLNFDGLSKSIDLMASRFTTMGIAGKTAIENLTNSAMNVGKNLVKSLTIDPLKTGLDEYETKMGAIQTILTNTASKGTTLSDVNSALEELNKYSDKTIYNFAEMSKNIGTFTAAGIDLKTSTESIKGIANLAAGSGSTALQASTAMYQLSQALAAGSLKLQDWNSVVNAGMGGELFQTALKKTAKSMGIVINESVPFRESLKDGWITAEVLTKTLSQFANDESLIKAATEVKTFTQMLSTMKETMQSGWAQSWEQIIGDKDQSTKTLTAINDAFGSLIGASTEARNEMLKFWNVNGGRDALIEAITNSFKFLGSILGPISNGLKEVFPPMMGTQLVALSVKIRDLTRNFKMSSETIEKIKATFKGVFAAFSIGQQVVSALVKNLLSIVKILFPMGDGILDVTSTIGYFLVGLNKTLKASDSINVAFGNVASVLKIVIGTLSNVVVLISSMVYYLVTAVANSNTFATFVGVLQVSFEKLTGGISDFISSIDILSDKKLPSMSLNFSNMNEVLNTLHGRFDLITEDIRAFASDKIVQPIKNMWANFKGGDKTLTSLKSSITAFTNGINLEDVLAVVSTGIFAAFFLKLRSIVSKGGEFIESITGILDELKNTLTAYQTDLKAGALIKIASAIAILAGSLVVLSFVDPKKLAPAIAAITIMFVDLFGSLAAFDKVIGDSSTLSIMGLSTAMIGLSVSLLVLVGVIKTLADINTGNVVKGLTAIVIMSITLSGVAIILSRQSGSIMKSSLGLNAFASAMYILVGVIERIGGLDPVKLGQGIVGLTMVIGVLAALLMSKQLKSLSLQSGLGLIGIAASLMIISSAVEAFGDLDPTAMQQGVFGLSAMLLTLAMFVRVAGDANQLLEIGGSMILIASSLVILSKAMDKMGSLDIDVIGKALFGMSLALASIVSSMRIMPEDAILQSVSLGVFASSLIILATALGAIGILPIDVIGKGLLGIAGALLAITVAMKVMPKNAILEGTSLAIFAAALVVLSSALVVLGTLSPEAMAKSLGMLAGSLGVISLAMIALEGGIAGAASLILMVGAITMLVPVLAMLGALPLENIAIGLGALAGVFAVIGLASLVLSPLAPVILMLAAGIALISVSVMAAGVGMSVFAAGLALLAASGYAGGQALAFIVTTIINLIPLMLAKTAEGIVLFAQIMTNNIPTLMAAFSALLLSMIPVITTTIPLLVEAFIVLLESILVSVANHIPKMIKAGWDILLSFIKGIADHTEEMAAMGVSITVAFINGVASKLPDLIDAAFNLIYKFIDGLANAIVKNAPRITMAIRKLLLSIMYASTVVFDQMASDFKTAGSAIMDNLKKAVAEKVDSTVSKITEVPKKALEGIKETISEFFTAGGNVIQGFIQGVTGAIDGVKEAGKNVGSTVLNAAKDMLGIHSPSTVFAWFGKMVDVGMADGVTQNASVPVNATGDMVQNAIAEANKNMNTKTGEQIGTNFTTGAASGIKKGSSKVKEEIKSTFELTSDMIEEKKFYNQISTQDELNMWYKIQNEYKIGSEERKKIDREIYTLKQTLIKETQDKEKAAFDHSISWIEDRKFYNKLSLVEELAAWQRVQNQYKIGTEERKRADREVYTLKKELVDKQKSVDQEYYDAQRDINVKLISDVKSLTQEYQNALDSRAKTLYDTFGLFDEVAKADSVDGATLTANLKTQIQALDEYNNTINNLLSKGVDSGLIDELRALGPKSNSQLKALNSMSSDQLSNYVTLWRTKHQEATEQATYELSTMRYNTQVEISKLQTEAAIKLEDYKQTWLAKTAELSTEVTNTMTGVTTMVNTITTEMKTETTNAFTAISNSIKTTLVDQNWKTIGENIVLGITEGIKSKIPVLANQAAIMAKSALTAAKTALGIKSPSKEFEQIGLYSGEGMVNGLKYYSAIVSEEGMALGKILLSSIQSSVANISDAINSDLTLTPTIRPILDSKNLQSGLNSTFGGVGLNVTASANKASNAVANRSSNSSDAIQNGVSPSVSFVQNNYSPTALSRIDIYRQTRNQISSLKGVVSAL